MSKDRKTVKTYISSKAILLFSLLTTVLTTLMQLHGFSENWAWEIAKTVISIDGIILGFVIVAVTLYFSERGYAMSRMVQIFAKHLEDFLKELRVVELSDVEMMEKRFSSSIKSAVEEIAVVPASVPICIVALSISICLALTLFGVSDATADEAIFRTVFSFALSLSVGFLMFGIYITYKFIEDTVMVASLAEMQKALRKMVRAITKELKEAAKNEGT